MALTGASAFFVATAFTSTLFVAALVCWGFFYWMAIPGVYSVLAGASTYPAERAGDAQAMMALGRVFGPIMGGTMLAAGSEVALGFASAAVMSFGGLLLLYVDRQRFVVVRQYGAWAQARASVDSAQHT